MIDQRGRPIHRGEYPELTWPAVIVGWFLGAIIAISIGYAALILGFSIEGSELAAILGWGILRGIMRRTSIVENNINQTIASAVNGASAGMMFSVPALFILARSNPEQYGEVTQFSYVLMVLACITGGVLGLAFVIPLRKQMIDFNRLAYPGGIAVAAILKSPGAGIKKAILLLAGALVSAVFYLVATTLYGDHPEAHVGDAIGAPTWLNLNFFLSLMTIGVGYIAGRGGLVFGYGGFICYFLLAPLLMYFGSQPVQDLINPVAASAASMTSAEQEEALKQVPNALRLQLFRPTGIGMLIGAAIGGIIAAFPLVVSAIRSMQEASRERRSGGQTSSDELPIGLLYVGVALGAVALIVIAMFSVPEMTPLRALAMAVLGTIWIWIAGVIVSECLGRTNWSPLSGMTLIAVTILILISSKLGSTACIVSSVLVGAAICVAIAQAGDMMLDLKSGYLVGARPKMQQVGQLLGTWLGPILVMGLILVLDKSSSGGLGSDNLPAPQGQALASVINGLIGGDVPSGRYAAGAGLGLLLAFSGLGGVGVQIGLGFYMPFTTVLTYSIGCFARIGADKIAGRKWVHDVGIPFAAGLIVGEALVGVGIAFYGIYSASAAAGG
ncbi:MAG: OPT family oligopeptide transporter [Planctomycetota bacterium]|jgi:putative OPT family oligopeptide transporter